MPDDPALPALRDLFPATGAPEFICDAVREAAGQRVTPEDAHLEYVRYRPAKSCVVLWSFPGERGGLLVSATIAHDDEMARVPARPSFRELAKAAHALRGQLGQPYVYVEERRVLVQAYPLDVRLPGLPLIESPQWREQTLLPALGLSATAHSLTNVSYKPRRRCVYRLETGSGAFMAKAFRDERGARLFASLCTIDAHLRAADAPWHVPSPVAYVPEAWLLVFAAVDGGIELKDVLKTARDDSSARSVVIGQFERAAAGLAALQRAPDVGLPVISPARLLTRFVSNMDGMADVEPALAGLLLRRIGELEEEASRLPPEPVVPTHGAFRHDQVLLCDNGQVVLDLDTVCLAGASADAGNFLSYLDVTALRRRHLRHVIEACGPAFEAATLRLPGVTPEWLAWHRAAGHVKKALRSFLSLDRKWPQMAEALLSGPAAVGALDEAASRRRP